MESGFLLGNQVNLLRGEMTKKPNAEGSFKGLSFAYYEAMWMSKPYDPERI